MEKDDKKNSTKRIVGLQYKVGQGLPKIVVKGQGKQAEEILRKRKLNGPVVVKDEELLKQLYRLPMDAEIGTDLFQLVAILLVHVFTVEEKTKGNVE